MNRPVKFTRATGYCSFCNRGKHGAVVVVFATVGGPSFIATCLACVKRLAEVAK